MSNHLATMIVKRDGRTRRINVSDFDDKRDEVVTETPTVDDPAAGGGDDPAAGGGDDPAAGGGDDPAAGGGDDSVDPEREALRMQAEALGLTVHHRAGKEKIQAQIDEKMAELNGDGNEPVE